MPRYKIAPGKYRTLADANGEVLRFRTKRAAEQAAGEEEAKVRGGRWHDPAAAQATFGEYANRWYAGQDLAASTMQNYRRHIEEHLLPHFNDMEVGAITKHDVDTGSGRNANAVTHPPASRPGAAPCTCSWATPWTTGCARPIPPPGGVVAVSGPDGPATVGRRRSSPTRSASC